MEEFGLGVTMADLDVPASITYLGCTQSLVPKFDLIHQLLKRLDVFAALPCHFALVLYVLVFFAEIVYFITATLG